MGGFATLKDVLEVVAIPLAVFALGWLLPLIAERRRRTSFKALISRELAEAGPSPQSTFRQSKGIDSHDIHFAIRVPSYREALQHFRSKGYDPDSPDPLRKVRENPTGRAGFPQIYVLDPDRNVIEVNAEQAD